MRQFYTLVSPLPKYKFTLMPTAIDAILSQGHNEDYGARPIRRFIEQHIITMLAKKILSESVPTTNTIKIMYEDDKFLVQTN
jgi:ATP-dependent Clp protease ATP-binding subunit ClpB